MVVIGAGLIGCSIALELATEKLKIAVLDKQQPGREASWAAAGMLSPAPDTAKDIPLLPLSRESLRIYPDFVRAVEQTSGETTGYTRNGTLQLFSGPEAERERDALLAEHKRLGLAAESISAGAAREQEPSLDSAARALAFLPDEGAVDPRLLMDAVAGAARRRGVEIRANSAVTSLWQEQGRCVGVCADRKIAAQHVILAAGCFSGEVDQDLARRCVPTRPVRGQMLALKRGGFGLQCVLRSERGYLVPRADGRVVAGSTTEEAGFEKKVTAAGTVQILAAALELCPELAGAEIVETWSGLRPGTPDALPILGPTRMAGLIAATGHFRNGILLAPITAKLVREWVTSGGVNFDVQRFSPLRFGDGEGENRAAERDLDPPEVTKP